jgi:hypothetical protein
MPTNQDATHLWRATTTPSLVEGGGKRQRKSVVFNEISDSHQVTVKKNKPHRFLAGRLAIGWSMAMAERLFSLQ